MFEESCDDKTVKLFKPYTEAIDIFLLAGHLIFQQLESVLSSAELSNKYDLKCGLTKTAGSSSECTGILLAINDFTED